MATRSSNPKKGMRLRYTGTYAPGVTGRYPPGVVVKVSHAKRKVAVQLDDSGLFADWPFDSDESAEPGVGDEPPHTNGA